MSRERSLVTGWALRYVFVMFIVVASVLYFDYWQTRERLRRDVQFLMRLQANELGLMVSMRRFSFESRDGFAERSSPGRG